MKFKRIFFGLAMVLATGMALAQNVLPPTISGANTEHRREAFEVGFLRFNPDNAALTATPSGTLANSQVLNLGLNRFTTVATGGDSTTLPTLSGSVMVVVVNGTVTSMNVFPNAAASTINALSAGTAFAVAGGKTAIFFQTAAGAWYALLTA